MGAAASCRSGGSYLARSSHLSPSQEGSSDPCDVEGGHPRAGTEYWPGVVWPTWRFGSPVLNLARGNGLLAEVHGVRPRVSPPQGVAPVPASVRCRPIPFRGSQDRQTAGRFRSRRGGSLTWAQESVFERSRFLLQGSRSRFSPLLVCPRVAPPMA